MFCVSFCDDDGIICGLRCGIFRLLPLGTDGGCHGNHWPGATHTWHAEQAGGSMEPHCEYMLKTWTISISVQLLGCSCLLLYWSSLFIHGTFQAHLDLSLWHYEGYMLIYLELNLLIWCSLWWTNRLISVLSFLLAAISAVQKQILQQEPNIDLCVTECT